MQLVTIQKASTLSGLHQDSIKKMITDNKIVAYKQDGFKRIMIDLDEFYKSFKPINNTDDGFDLSIFNV
jgi:hypothetical protein